MTTVKLGVHREITLPADAIKRLGITPGAEFELIEQDKMIVLVPRKYIPQDQQWYYTEEWQRMMREAFEEAQQDRLVGPFDTVEEALRALKETPV